MAVLLWHVGFASDVADSTWRVESLERLNTRSDEVLIGWDGREIYFGRLAPTARLESGKRWFLENRQDFTSNRLMGWSEFALPNVTMLRANRFPSWDALGEIQHAAVDSERGVVVMSVWMEDGQFDLFMAQREGGDWSIPRALEALNSPQDEVFPNFYDGDLLFGSDRPGGQGGFDVYRSNRTSLFLKATPLPAPINSVGDELTAVPGGSDSGSGFYVSAVRMTGRGGVDLWWMGPMQQASVSETVILGMEIRHRREPMLNLDVSIRERGGKHIFSGALDEWGRVEIGALTLDAAVEVRFEGNARKSGSLPDGAVCHVYEQCEIGSCLDSPWPGWNHIRSYRLEGGEAFVFDLLPLDALGALNRPSDIDLSLLRGDSEMWVGRFESSSANLSANHQQAFIKWLKLYQDLDGHWPKNLKLEIEGHTDRNGVRSDNQDLSMQRAQYVAGIAADLGVPEDCLQASGLGSAFASGRDQQDRKVTVRWVLD